MKKLILAIAATLVLPGALAQEKKDTGKKGMEMKGMEMKGMEMKDMDKMHGGTHDKMEKKAKAKDAAKKGEAAKKDAHGH